MITIGFVECLYQRIRGALPWSRDKLRILEVHFIYFFFRNAGSMFRRFWGGGILLVGNLLGFLIISLTLFIDFIIKTHNCSETIVLNPIEASEFVEKLSYLLMWSISPFCSSEDDARYHLVMFISTLTNSCSHAALDILQQKLRCTCIQWLSHMGHWGTCPTPHPKPIRW